MPQTPPPKYRAFLSYCHADTREAERVHRTIEGFRIDPDLVGRQTSMGPVPSTLRPVFRDRHDFETGSDFKAETIAALDASAALVILCSPASARSNAVNEEVRLFRFRHPERPLIPVMLKGTAETRGKDYFPPALRFEIEPDGTLSERPQVVLAADIRDVGDGYDLALAKVIARLIGVAPDEIYRRAERQRRQRHRRIISGLSAVAVALAVLGLWAEINRREAVRQRLAAEHNLFLAQRSASDIVFNVFDSIRNQQGIRTAALDTILGSARLAIDRLVGPSQNDKNLRHIKAGFFQKMIEMYALRGQTAKADAATTDMLALAGGLVSEAPQDSNWQHDLALAYGARGGVLADRNRYAAALTQFRSAQIVVRRLLHVEPRNAEWRLTVAKIKQWLGDALQAQGKLAQAAQSYRAGLIMAALAFPSLGSKATEALKVRAGMLVRLGDVAVQTSSYDEATRHYQSSLILRRALADADRGNLALRRDMAESLGRLGECHAGRGDLAAARASFDESLSMVQANAASDPENAQWQRDVAVASDKLGNVLFQQNDVTGALQKYEVSRGIARRLAADDPSNAVWHQDALLADGRIADVARATGDTDRALGLYRSLLAERQLASGPDGDTPKLQRGTYQTHVAIGDTLMAKKDFAGALASYETAVALAGSLLATDASNATVAADAAAVYGKIGQALTNLQRFPEARDKFVAGRALLAPLVERAPDVLLWRQNLDGFDRAIKAFDAIMGTKQ